MASALPAPAAPGQLIIGTDPVALDLSKKAGAVTLTPGLGSTLRRAGRSVLIDSVFTEPAESFSLFVPGTATAGTVIGTWKNNLRARTVYVRKLLANFRVAQTTGDVANFFRLKITDTAAGTAVLPFTVAAQRVYLLDQGFASVIDKGMHSYVGGPGFNSCTANGTVATAVRFRTSQVQTLTGINLHYGLFLGAGGSGGTATIVGSPIVNGRLLDASGNTLAAGSVVNPTNNASEARFVFDHSVQVQPGIDYFMAFDLLGSYPALTGANAGTNVAGIFISIDDNQDRGANGAMTTFAPSGISVLADWTTAPADQTARQAAVNALSWPAIIAGTAGLPAWLTTGTGPIGTGAPRNFAWEMLGAPSGLAVLNGDLTYTIDSVGAPLGTSIGADLNVHSVLSAS